MTISHRPRLLVFIGVLTGLALLLAACSGSDPTATPPPPMPVPSSTAPVLPPTVAPSPTPRPLTVPEIVQKLRPSVVHILTEAVQLDFLNRPVPIAGVGTGQIIDEQGHILTNNHVVEGAERIIVTLFDGRALEAEIIGRDPSTDLAVIRIPPGGLTAIEMGSSEELRVGERVIAIGHALDLPGGPTVTGGLISALGRSIDISPTITIQHLIQTHAAINPGNSGGPLVNMKGQMVGINTAKIPTGEGIGFSIALDPVRPLIDELINIGRIERGFLGISAVTITEGLAMSQGLPVSFGVGIIGVAPGSPADLVGLMAGDIIVALGGQEVRNTSQLDSILVDYRSGSSVRIDLLRGEERVTALVTLGDRPQR